MQKITHIIFSGDSFRSDIGNPDQLSNVLWLKQQESMILSRGYSVKNKLQLDANQYMWMFARETDIVMSTTDL
jgi:hypothetical protein